jgi:hypothetical protein
MDDLPPMGEYSPKMIWDVLKMTKEGLDEHSRVHKKDIDKIHEDNIIILQSIAGLNQSVSLIAQKIECFPTTPASIPVEMKQSNGKYAWITGMVIAGLYGISQFYEYFKK